MYMFKQSDVVTFCLIKIYLPTGTKIVTKQNSGMRGWSSFMNVDIIPGLADVSKTSGMCGNFDGEKSNDNGLDMHPHTSSFMLMDEESVNRHRYDLITNKCLV